MLICNTQTKDAYIIGRGGAGFRTNAGFWMKVSSCKVQSNTFIHKTLFTSTLMYLLIRKQGL